MFNYSCNKYSIMARIHSQMLCKGKYFLDIFINESLFFTFYTQKRRIYGRNKES